MGRKRRRQSSAKVQKPVAAWYRDSAAPFSAGPQSSTVKIACHGLVLHGTTVLRYLCDSAGSHASAGIAIWQSTALMRDHDRSTTGVTPLELRPRSRRNTTTRNLCVFFCCSGLRVNHERSQDFANSSDMMAGCLLRSRCSAWVSDNGFMIKAVRMLSTAALLTSRPLGWRCGSTPGSGVALGKTRMLFLRHFFNSRMRRCARKDSQAISSLLWGRCCNAHTFRWRV